MTKQNDTPKVWGDMSDAEKGALLLAHHEGKMPQWLNPDIKTRLYSEWKDCPTALGIHDHYAYRIKPPAPVVETVKLYTRKPDGYGGSIYIEAGSIQATDGKPDLSTIRMEDIQ